MKREIKLSDVRKWTGKSEQTEPVCRRWIDVAVGIDTPLGLVAKQRYPAVAAILQNAPSECVQVWDGFDWHGGVANTPGSRAKELAYRLHPDCELVDDTVSEWEFVNAYQGNMGYWKLDRDIYLSGLSEAANYEGYICTEVEDAEGRVLYVSHWAGPYGVSMLFAKVEHVVQNIIALGGKAVWPLTPTRVVFKKGA